MANYKLFLQYEGTRYQGWQRQSSTGNTIQGRLEALLEKMCGNPIQIHGSGRTDAGVHALAQVANVHMSTDLSCGGILEYMNRYLPEDIAVLSVEEVPERFHSRLNAKGKTYRYTVVASNLPHVFLRNYSHMVSEKLDVGAMRQAASLLCGTRDFKAFTSARRGKKSTVRTLEAIDIEQKEDVLTFTFRGDGFLYHMVRILMGTLLEVGCGQREPEEMTDIIKSGERAQAGALVPAKGLTLVEVRY